ncbi:hypothetical protein GCM10009599_29240 [Luteococcus peritonei]
MAFDFDGTLTDYLSADRAAVETARRLCAPRIAPGAFFEASGEAIMDFHELVEQGRVDPLDMHRWRLAATCDRLGLAAPQPEAVTAYREALLEHCAPLPGARELLTELQSWGLRLAVITNAYDPDEQTARIGRTFPAKLFEQIVVAGTHGQPKPSPEPFVHLAQLMQLPPRSIAYVGDLPRHDIPGARAAGLSPVIVSASASTRDLAAGLGAPALTELATVRCWLSQPD